MYDVTVIGGGIIGTAVAYELSKYKISVLLLEKENDIAMGTTKANSAIIHAGYDPEPGTLMAKLNVEGSRMTKGICRQLTVPYQQIGSLVLALTEADMVTLRGLYDRGLKNGVPKLELLEGKEVLKIEPHANPLVKGALFAPTGAITSPWELALALAETAVLNGVEIKLKSPVSKINKVGEHFKLEAGGRYFDSRLIVNAAGIYADQVHQMAAKPEFKIIPNKGEYYLLDKPEAIRARHVVFQCPTAEGKGVLVSPTVHGNLIVGPSADSADSREKVGTTRQGLAYVMAKAKESVPSIDFRENIRNFAGLRALADVDDFIIQEAESTPGFFDVAGIKSPGLSAAPAIARLVLEMVGQKINLKEKSELVQTRQKTVFSRLSKEEKNRLIQSNPRYGRILCRCEGITEGEVLDAIESPIPPVSLDGIKRRCNVGMGRCQGGFCGPRVLALLAKEKGVNPVEILQDKSGSFILTGETKGGRPIG